MGDALTYGSGSYIAHPVVKAIIVMLVAGSCYLVALIIRTNAINNRKSLLMSPPDLFGDSKDAAADSMIPTSEDIERLRSKLD